MTNEFITEIYNQDVLPYIANFSSDEVFISLGLVNKLLDMFPQNLFSNSVLTFLDLGCKLGIFLCEITKRLIVGLKNTYQNIDEKLKYIFKEQIFGINVTTLICLLSGRTAYCNKFPNS